MNVTILLNQCVKGDVMTDSQLFAAMVIAIVIVAVAVGVLGITG
jgi:ABC-type uncharacterized transport system permease subunit